MDIKKRTTFIILFLLIFCTINATDYYVDASTGNNTTGDGSSGYPWLTITYALSQVSGSGHIIHVVAGTYNTVLGEIFPIVMENGVSLSGAGAGTAIIDAEGTECVLRCIGVTDASTFIEGFTITGGEGGAIYMSAGSALTIKNNIFSNNEGYYSGSVFYIDNSWPQIKGNRIINNSLSWYSYGCIYIDGSSSAPRLINNLIVKNDCAGIYCSNYCTPTINNNTISDNSGNGIFLHYSHPNPDSIVNNIISYNSGYGIYEDYSSSDPGIVSYNLFFSNSSGLYYDESSTAYYTVSSLNASVAECKNNIDDDPFFTDRANNDYHELSYSHAIDSGDPGLPCANEPEDNGDRINIGAYGNTSEAAIYVAPPELPLDLYVNASSGSNSTGDGTSGNPWQTITYALSQIYTTGHTVHVAAGTYNTALGETFPINMKNGVSLSGTGASATIIYSDETARVIACNGISDASTFIEGFTITGVEVGAMTILAGSDLTIRNNIFSDNEYSYGYGTVFYIDNSSPQIVENRIINNFMSYYSSYSAIYISGSSSAPRLVNNLIAKNSGDAIDCRSYCTPTIINNTISDNSGNGIFLHYSYPNPDSIVNNIISYNSEYGIYEDNSNSDPGIVSYNLFFSNSSGLYYDESSTAYYTASSLNTGVAECANNIDGDPAFKDRANNDYHIQSASSAVDMGDPNSPLDPDGSRADIGAYYFIMPPPDAPVATGATFVGQTDLIINWNSAVSATGYLLDISTDNTFSTFIAGFESRDVVNMLSYSVTGLTASSVYYYRVRAYNEGGTSPSSNVISIVTLASPPVPPSAPVVYAGTDITQTSFIAAWEPTDAATSYRIDVAVEIDPVNYVSGYNDLEVLNATECQVTGLTANTDYYYWVRACNSGGASVNSDTVVVTTLPDPPPAPWSNAATDITQTGFTANWESASTATGYYLDVATDIDFTSFVAGYNNLDVNGVTSYSVTGLSSNSYYYYRISAYNTGGTGPYSGFIQAVTLPDPPEPPTFNDPTDVTQTSLTLNWNNSSGATGYYLDVAQDNTFASFISGYEYLDVSNVTSYGISGLTSSTEYFYRVRAYNSGGEGDYSEIRSVVTLPDPPAAPVAYEATDTTQNSFTAHWDHVALADLYFIDWSTDESFQSYSQLQLTYTTAYTLSGLELNTTYYYRILAYNNGGTGDPSNIISVTTLQIPAPPAPTANEASYVGQTDFTASWNSSETATGYYIDVCSDSEFTSCNPYNLYVGNVTSYSIMGLTANTTYYYRITAYNAGGTSGNSNTITVTTLLNPPDPPPAPVTYSATNITQTSFNANWETTTDATGYRLDLSTDASFNSFVTGYEDVDLTNITSFAIDGLSASTTYYYRLRAYNSGGTSDNSETITVTTLPWAPPVPYPYEATSITTTSFTANWETTDGAIGYALHIATDEAFTQFVTGYQNLDVFNVTSYEVTGLDPNTTYYYCVSAYNEGGESSNSGGIQVTTLLEMPDLPDAPTADPATNITQTQFQANWTPASGTDGFYLDVAYDDVFSSYVTGYNNLDVGYDISLDIGGLSSNTVYYYRVRGHNVSGTGDNSNVVSVTTLPDPPPAPTGLSASSCNNEVYLQWNQSTEAGFMQYNVYWGTAPAPSSLYASYNNPSWNAITISDLVNGQTYYFRVTTVISPGVESDYSTTTSVKVKTGVIPRIKSKWGKVLICYNPNDSLTSFQWFVGTSSITGATAQYYVTAGQSGYYYVVASDHDGCYNHSNLVYISGSKSISVYPNPAKSNFTLNLSSDFMGETVVTIYNSTGIKSMEYRTEKRDIDLNCEIPVGNLKDGIYTIEVNVNDEEIEYTKLIIIE